MSDEFTPYERGMSRLLEHLAGDQPAHHDALLLQARLERNINQARKYDRDPAQNTDLNRILDQLIDLSLEATGKSFNAWCEEVYSDESLVTLEHLYRHYAGTLQSLREGRVHQDLTRILVAMGARLKTGRVIPQEDMLARYKEIPLHALFLYTSEDPVVESYILDHWGQLETLSRDLCDFLPSVDQFRNAEDAYDYIEELDIIKASGFRDISHLPGLFFWDHKHVSEYISFGPRADAAAIRHTLRVVFEEIRREPTIASIKRAKALLGSGNHPVLIEQRTEEKDVIARQAQSQIERTPPVDIGVIIALQEEFDLFFPTLAGKPTVEIDPRSGRHFFLFTSPHGMMQRPYRCVAGLIGRMGPTDAVLMTESMMERYHPQTFVLLGMSASIHDDIRLGEVIIADSVDNYIDRGKVGLSEQRDSSTMYFSGQVYQCSVSLLHFLHTFKYAHPQAYQQWRQSCSRFFYKLVEKSTSNELKATGLLKIPPSYVVGPLASGPLVISSSAFKKTLQLRNRSFLGVEMEAGGMMAVLHQVIDSRKSLILRGISDYGDERKKALDQIQGGIMRRYAMHNVVSLFWKLLEVGAFPQNG